MIMNDILFHLFTVEKAISHLYKLDKFTFNLCRSFLLHFVACHLKFITIKYKKLKIF